MKPQLVTGGGYDPARYRKWYERNAERKKAYAKARYDANPSHYIAISKQYREKNPKYWRESQRRLNYGLTQEAFDAFMEQQGGACAICKVELDDSTKSLTPHVDHDHSTGKVRGLLCLPCNASLGHIERPGFLEAALKYLESAK